MSDWIVPLGSTSTPGSSVPVQTSTGGSGTGQVGSNNSVLYNGKVYHK
jgi:hypothetical protein